MDELLLSAEQASAVLQALAPEAAMERRARERGQESTAALFRRLAAQGASMFQWHPRVDGRYQTLILRPDLTLEVWADSRRREDFATTCALEPVRERLAALARAWGRQEPLLPDVPAPGRRTRLSPLAARSTSPLAARSTSPLAAVA